MWDVGVAQLAYRKGLQRLTYNFPSGFAGTGLLVLRIALSTSLLTDGARLVGRARELGNGSDGPALFFGVLLMLCAVLIGTGFLTNIVQPVVVFMQAVTLGTRVSAIGLMIVNAGVFHIPLLELALALGLAMTGPGAYSIDARLFGRQEIIIPPSLDRPLN
jgi:uncharacterized membrane protein YphA (DoxX/SURF4 family)